MSNTGVTLSFLLAEIRISRPALLAIGVTDASDGGLEQLSGDASPMEALAVKDLWTCIQNAIFFLVAPDSTRLNIYIFELRSLE